MRCYPHFTLTRGRSPGFGSLTTNLSPSSDSLSLRLRLSRLNLARHHHSPVHSTKGTPSGLTPPTACRHTVSGSISLRSRGSFHLSLTVLSAIGCQGVFSLGRWSSRIPTGFLVSRSTWVHSPQSTFDFAYRALTVFGRPFHAVLLSNVFLTLRGVCSASINVPLPHECNGCSLSHTHGLGSSAFARHYSRNHMLSSLPQGT
jgi:hypothetical protein